MNTDNAYILYKEVVDEHNNIAYVDTEYFFPGDRILVIYEDESDYCKDEKHPYKYANGRVVSDVDDILIVNDSGKQINIKHEWIVAVQDGSLPTTKSYFVKRHTNWAIK